MPTPAFLATASRLASGPPALNTAFAAASTRSRLRTASARGLRTVSVACSAMSAILITNRLFRFVSSFIPLIANDLFGGLALRLDHSCGGPLKNGGGLRIWRWMADLEGAADLPVQSGS